MVDGLGYEVAIGEDLERPTVTRLLPRSDRRAGAHAL